MKVLLTGASGFIGRHLAESLRARHALLSPPRAELDLLDDGAVFKWLSRERPDAIVHAATTPGHRNAPPLPDLAARNLRMFLALTRDPNLVGRFILLGSGAEYDQTRMPQRAGEESLGQFVPQEPSALSKLTLSRMCQALPHAVVLRPFGVYGPHEDWQIRFISNALCKALHGKPITLRQDRLFDYVHVDDLVELTIRLLEGGPRNGTYNVTPDASSRLHAIAELARDAAARVTGRSVEIRVAQEGMGLAYSGDNARLRKDFPELPRVSLEAGIERLCAFHAGQIDSIDPRLLESDK